MGGDGLFGVAKVLPGVIMMSPGLVFSNLDCAIRPAETSELLLRSSTHCWLYSGVKKLPIKKREIFSLLFVKKIDRKV